MVLQAFTLADAQALVIMALKGSGIAETSVGDPAILLAINRAIGSVVSAVGLPEFAGDLYTSGTLTFTDCIADQPSSVLLPIALEMSDGVTQRKALTELMRADKTGLTGSTAEYVYAFAGAKVFIRPTPAAGATATLHYIGIPNLLVNATDVIQASPALFQAICLEAAVVCMGQWSGADQSEVARLSTWRQSLVDGFSGRRDQELLKAWAEQTGRSKYGPQFNNAGV